MSKTVGACPELAWEFDKTRVKTFGRAEAPLSEDPFHHGALGEELLRLPNAEGPFISFGGSLVAVACLNPHQGRLVLRGDQGENARQSG